MGRSNSPLQLGCHSQRGLHSFPTHFNQMDDDFGAPRKNEAELTILNPNIAKMYLAKTRQGASDVASRRLGKVEAYLTVREFLPEASKGADVVAWCESSGFGR